MDSCLTKYYFTGDAVVVAVLADESMTTTPETSNADDDVAVLVATLGVFSTYEGTLETLSRGPDIKPSNIV